MAQRTRGQTLVALLYAGLSINAFWQVVTAMLGQSGDPSPLTMLQACIGVASAATMWLTWRADRRAWAAALVHCAISVGMLVALPDLVDIDREGRNGVYFGAATMLALGIGLSWYLRRSMRTAPASHGARNV